MLVTSDLHLTDRPRDEYRWHLFPWLAELMEKTGSHLLILGDLTDAKDGHSAQLVNRVVRTLAELPGEVWVLKGNHDYVDPGNPFFGFLNEVENVHFVIEPRLVEVGPWKIMMLPHTRTPVDDWTALDMGNPDMIVCHQTFDGADAGNGFKLQGGISSKFFSPFYGTVLSGDIHVPQKVGDVIYVGTPYPVAFGDSHKPRVLQFPTVLNKFEFIEHHPPTIRKKVFDIGLAGIDGMTDFVKTGDQAKVRVTLAREDYPAWSEIKDRIRRKLEAAGVYVHSIELQASPEAPQSRLSDDREATPLQSHSDVLAAFCEARGVHEGERWMAEDVLERIGKR